MEQTQREPVQVWSEILIVALANKRSFRRLAAENFVTPDLIDCSLIRFHKDWLLGIYLPENYWDGKGDIVSAFLGTDWDGLRSRIIANAHALLEPRLEIYPMDRHPDDLE